jgi:SAM-dependent methyltransferase
MELPESPVKAGTLLTSGEPFADIAAVTALLQIADELGVLPALDAASIFTAADLAEISGLPLEGIERYLEALRSASLIVPAGESGEFRLSDDFADLRHQAGYLSWALSANRPFIENARRFLLDPERAAAEHQRDGRRVAVSSRWIGEQAFYPAVFSAITTKRPDRIVDLGAGAGALLIKLLGVLPKSTGVALDISADACAEAVSAAGRAGVRDRLEVCVRSVQSLAEDPSPVEGADVVHAGFVCHDVAAEPEVFTAVLRRCREALRPGGFLAITDAVPYATDEREHRFSSLFTYLHAEFMDVNLPAEDEWTAMFVKAGFTSVDCVRHRFPGGRLFLVSK